MGEDTRAAGYSNTMPVLSYMSVISLWLQLQSSIEYSPTFPGSEDSSAHLDSYHPLRFIKGQI